MHAHVDASRGENDVMRELSELDFGPEMSRSSEAKRPQTSGESAAERPYGAASSERNNGKRDGSGVSNGGSKGSGKGDAIVTKGLDQPHYRPQQLPIQTQQPKPHHADSNQGAEDGRKNGAYAHTHDNKGSEKDKEKDKDPGLDKGSNQGSNPGQVVSPVGLRHAPYQGGHMTVSVGRFSLCFQPLAEPYIDSCDWRIVGPVYSGTVHPSLIRRETRHFSCVTASPHSLHSRSLHSPQPPRSKLFMLILTKPTSF